METEQIQLDLEKLHKQFNKKICEYYKKRRRKITWDNEYNIESELTEIKKIWSDVLYAECEEVMKSTSNDKNVNKDEVKKFYDERLKQYEDIWKLTDDNVPLYFLEAFEKETIDSSEKLKKLIDFTKNDLKFKDDFYDDYFMFYFIGLLKFGEKSTLTKEDLFYVLDLNKGKNLSPSTLLEYEQKFELDCSCVDKLLSFAENYKFPDEENENEDYKKQANDFFDLIWYMLFYSEGFSLISDNVAKNLEIAQKIFTYINKNMPQFKHLFKKIDKYNKGVELSNYLNNGKICLSEKNSNDGDVEVVIDYFKYFNGFVSDKLWDNGCYKYNYRCHNVDGLNELHDKLISDFSNKIKKYDIEITEDIKKELLFDQESFDEILKKTNRGIIGSSNDFDKLIEFINLKTKDVEVGFSRFLSLTAVLSLQISDIEKFLKLYKNNSLSICDLYYFFWYEIDTKQRYTFDDITKFLLAAKNRFTKSKKQREEDVKAFCDLLAYFLEYVEENETEYIKFEQDIFDWIGKNIPEIEFSNEIIKSSGLENVLNKRCVKLEFAKDNNKNKNDNTKVKFSNGESKDDNDSENEKSSDSCFEDDSEDEDKKISGITVMPNFFYVRTLFEEFVEQKLNEREIEYKTLDELSNAYKNFIDSFLEESKTKKTIVQKIINANGNYRKQLQEWLRLHKPELVRFFLKKISPNIIKSSNDQQCFLETLSKVIGSCEDKANDNDFMNCVIDLIADNSVAINNIISFLSIFQSETNKFELTILLKACTKIQNGQKWNLEQIKEILGYGKVNKNEKISENINCFFELLIIFVNHADLKNKIDNNDTNEINIEDSEDIKNNADMTYEKFVNEILDYVKEIYFNQKDFSWSEHFEFCSSFAKLEKILAEKNIDILELQQNKLKDESKLIANTTKNEIRNGVKGTGLNSTQDKIKKLFDKKILELKIKVNDNKNNNKLIARIVLYVLAVVAFVVLLFSIIKAFWFLSILSFILCLVFTFVALNIKHKTINKQLENISTGYLNYQPDIVKPGKNNKLEEVPKINDGSIWKHSHENQI